MLLDILLHQHFKQSRPWQRDLSPRLDSIWVRDFYSSSRNIGLQFHMADKQLIVKYAIPDQCDSKSTTKCQWALGCKVTDKSLATLGLISIKISLIDNCWAELRLGTRGKAAFISNLALLILMQCHISPEWLWALLHQRGIVLQKHFRLLRRCHMLAILFKLRGKETVPTRSASISKDSKPFDKV